MKRQSDWIFFNYIIKCILHALGLALFFGLSGIEPRSLLGAILTIVVISYLAIVSTNKLYSDTLEQMNKEQDED